MPARLRPLVLVSISWVLAALGCGGDELVILLQPQDNPMCAYPPQARITSLLVRVVEAEETKVAVLTQHDQCLAVDIPLDPSAIAAYFKQRGFVVGGVDAELKIMLAAYGYGRTNCTPTDPFAICLLSEVVSPEKRDALPIGPVCLPDATSWSVCKALARPQLNAQ